LQFPYEIGHLGVADVRAVFLEGESRHDDLGGFGHLDAAGAMYAGGDDRLVKVADGLRGFRRVAGDDFDDPGDRAFPVAGIDAFRALADVEILQPFQPRFLFEDRDADFFGGTGIDGGLVDDGGDLAGRVAMLPIGGDLLLREVETDGWVTLSEFDRQRQADLAQADDGDRGLSTQHRK
jgi:hypothetical protein